MNHLPQQVWLSQVKMVQKKSKLGINFLLYYHNYASLIWVLFLVLWEIEHEVGTGDNGCQSLSFNQDSCQIWTWSLPIPAEAFVKSPCLVSPWHVCPSQRICITGSLPAYLKSLYCSLCFTKQITGSLRTKCKSFSSLCYRRLPNTK